MYNKKNSNAFYTSHNAELLHQLNHYYDYNKQFYDELSYNRDHDVCNIDYYKSHPSCIIRYYTYDSSHPYQLPVK